MENKYIREFVEHYVNYGVDKIFIYDNNELNGEKFEEVLSDYIESRYVKIINFRGKKKAIFNIMNNCYKNNFRKYDWLIFYEIDEFIHLKFFKNIKLFLNLKIFNDCQRIQLNWLHHTDNNLLFYDKRSLKTRFPEKEISARGKKIGGVQGIKSILRGHISGINIIDAHFLDRKLSACDGFGKIVKNKRYTTNISDYYYNYIDHYYGKSTEEFINKLNKKDALFEDARKRKIKKYFFLNKITKEKIDLIENKTGYDLTNYRILLNSSKKNNNRNLLNN